ncbi:MAG: acyl-CoA mutase large subunit family protein [Ignavibacteria bacterium]|nr:acyl-CoA mutase large subunit family protein [Ignavibacteria bacterium]
MLSEKPDLLNDFEELNYEKWKKFVEQELKGIPFEKKLITKTYEGINLKPLYDRDDIKNLEFLNSKPGFPDFVRGSQISGYTIRSWNIHQFIPYTLPEDFNKTLIHNLQNGQNCIYIYPDWYTLNNLNPPSHYTKEHYQNGLSIFHVKDFESSLKNVDLYKYPIFIKAGFNGVPIFTIFLAYLKKNKIDYGKISGAIYIDPYEYLILYGQLPDTLENTFDCLAAITKWVSKNSVNFKTINISGLIYHNAGANIIQELAYSFATAIEYINYLLDRNIDIETIANKITFTFGVGSFYFMEIAKLRAARILWSKILESYGCKESNRKAYIVSVTSSYNKSVLDPYVNILRATTEAFSAILGGADSIQISPFDEYQRLPDEFSERIARNIQIILNSESNLYKLIDPAGGSYYVEYLTKQIAEQTFNIIKEIISKGGILNLLKNEYIHNEIDKVHQLKVNDFVKRKYTLVGVNRYANAKEKKLKPHNQNLDEIYKNRFEALKKIQNINNYNEVGNILDIENVFNNIDLYTNFTIEQIYENISFKPTTPVKIRCIKQHRIAEIFEVLREVTEEIKIKKGTVPKVFLATMGSTKDYKARADFSREFFEIAGFDILSNKGYDLAEEAVIDVQKSNSDITVICSTDELYEKYVPSIIEEIKKNNIKTLLVLAGYPENKVEEYKKLGVDEFIYLGVNAFDTLNRILKKII